MTMKRWLVAFCCAWINLFIFAVLRSSGLIYVQLIELFRSTHQQAAYSVSLIGSVASTTGLASAFLSHYFTPQTLIISGIILCSFSVSITAAAKSIYHVIVTLGILQGIGIGLVTCLLPSILTRHFTEQKSIALGISYAGATLGAFIFPLINQWMLNKFGFHLAMLLLGILMLPALIGAIFLIVFDRNSQVIINSSQHRQPFKSDAKSVCFKSVDGKIASIEKATNVESEDSDGFFRKLKHHILNDYRLLSNFYFFLCAFTYINFIIDFIAFIIILPDVAKEKNIDVSDSKWLLSIFAITDFIGRLLSGWLFYWKLTTEKFFYILSIFLLGLCMLLIVIVERWINFVLVTLLCGFVSGSQMILSPAILTNRFGSKNTAIAFGYENFICGIKDVYGNYNCLGYILFISVIVNIALWSIHIIYRKFVK
ncbi:monocarboxylate transporter 12-like protein [Sarcoptes scabiei]|uniref:Monocarboxylate transporter 12-like protein n=1 Tax=Sarcoptes scabiei TaxID=52283 RepID=A0A131ZUY1_SARSC|nr:monocarboxylate transporter 12-like protein [Sarcoptes scabiei]